MKATEKAQSGAGGSPAVPDEIFITKFAFDVTNRQTRVNGDPADSSQSSVVTNNYDSIDRVLEESLQIGSAGTTRYTTGSAWESDHQRTALTYPNGRVVLSTFDELDRLKTLKDQGAATPIATWRYIGTDRVLEMAYSSGLTLTHLNDARTASANQPGMPAGELRGFDGVQRMTAHRWLEANLDANGFVTSYVSTTSVVGFQHAFDAANNKLSEARLHDSGNSEAYDYDSAYRLNEFDRGTLNSSLTEVTTPTTTSGLLKSQIWNLDGPGNWASTTTTEVGGSPDTENRTHNNLNQISSVATGGPPVSLLYDANGNLTDDGTFLYAWDAKNRLRQVTRKSDSVVVGSYSYDARGRRIRRVFIIGTDPAQTVHYYLDGQRVIEERQLPTPDSLLPDELARQFTYGLYIDEALTLDRDLNANGSATDAGERLFYHANSLYSVFGLSDSSRNFAERYLYDGYGRPILWLAGPDMVYGTGDDVRTVNGSSTVQNVRLFTGREWDAESQLLYFRARYQSPQLGRFISRDPADDIDGPMLYLYVRNDPIGRVDPAGFTAIQAGTGPGTDARKNACLKIFPGPDTQIPNAKCIAECLEKNKFKPDKVIKCWKNECLIKDIKATFEKYDAKLICCNTSPGKNANPCNCKQTKEGTKTKTVCCDPVKDNLPGGPLQKQECCGFLACLTVMGKLGLDVKDLPGTVIDAFDYNLCMAKVSG